MSALMSNAPEPVVGNWYRRLADGQLFCVVALDETNGLVETRFQDGDVDEIEAGNWLGMDLEPAPAPDDWTAGEKAAALEPWDEGYSAAEDLDWLRSLDSGTDLGHESDWGRDSDWSD